MVRFNVKWFTSIGWQEESRNQTDLFGETQKLLVWRKCYSILHLMTLFSVPLPLLNSCWHRKSSEERHHQYNWTNSRLSQTVDAAVLFPLSATKHDWNKRCQTTPPKSNHTSHDNKTHTPHFMPSSVHSPRVTSKFDEAHFRLTFLSSWAACVWKWTDCLYSVIF